MSELLDLVGETYGSALVIMRAGARKNHTLWKCECLKCNKPYYVTSTNLQSGNTTGCQKCKNNILTMKERKIVAFRYSQFGHSVSEIADWYGVSWAVVSYAIKREGADLRGVNAPRRKRPNKVKKKKELFLVRIQAPGCAFDCEEIYIIETDKKPSEQKCIELIEKFIFFGVPIEVTFDEIVTVTSKEIKNRDYLIIKE